AGTFRGWDARLPADVELLAIQYPGRQERQDEPFVTDVEAMLCAIDDALLPLLDRPFALAGGHGLVVTAAEEVCAILRQRLAADVPGGVPA
ncbi:TPA: thioesterase II family protein, partial [Pseudomonas aeruginosa]